MAVDGQEIKPAIQVVVEKENAKRQQRAARAADSLRLSLVGKEHFVLLHVKGRRLVREISDGNAQSIFILKATGIDAHRAARAAVRIEGQARRCADFAKRAVLLI